MKMMIQNEAQTGCAIVMEVKTGKSKRLPTLVKQKRHVMGRLQLCHHTNRTGFHVQTGNNAVVAGR
jgi:hypothetical protein